MPGLLGRAACENVPETRPGAPSDADGYDKFREQMEASGASRRFFYAPARWRRSLKTQQCDHAETPGLRPACLVIQARGLKRKNPVTILRDGDDFEHKLEVIDLPLRRQTNFMESLILAQDERWRRA